MPSLETKLPKLSAFSAQEENFETRLPDLSLPADAYIGVEHACFVGASVLAISAVIGVKLIHYTMTKLNIDDDSFVTQHLYTADVGNPGEPFFTGSFVAGQPYFYDPATRTGLICTDPSWRDREDAMPVQLYPPVFCTGEEVTDVA